MVGIGSNSWFAAAFPAMVKVARAFDTAAGLAFDATFFAAVREFV